MTSLQTARQYDAQGDPVRAIEWYERALNEGPCLVDLFIDLAMVYFICTDFGYASAKRLPQELAASAYRRAQETLSRAEATHGSSAEILFWRKYFEFIVLGAGEFKQEATRLAQQGTLVPYVHLYSRFASDKFSDEARLLMQSVSGVHTAKARYIRSVLGQAE
jgi:hypothetical protein